jgi:hypothetical protein
MLKKSAVSWNTDLTDDSLFFMVGKLVADGDTQFVRSIYTLANIGQTVSRSSLWRIIFRK